MTGLDHEERFLFREEILALDTRTYKLNPNNVVIADDNGPESIGGIMGGEHSGCDENTVNVLIESALWDPINIAKTGRAHGIITDARYRFERGVDPEYMVPGLERTTELVRRGYAEGDIRKILGGNTLRLMRAVEKTARQR